VKTAQHYAGKELIMMKNLTRVSLAVSASASALLLFGCMVTPVPYAGEPVATVYAPVAPPAPYVEVQPAIPYVGAVWVGGFWNWAGGRYAWVPGRYERSRPGYRWEAPRWNRDARGWQRQGGGWQRQGGGGWRR
jgi:hypothetical protein